MDIKLAVIGTGYWGKNLVRNFARTGALCCICDSNLQTAQKMAQEYQVVALNWEAVLEDKSINAVAIAAPAALHYKLAKDALLAGKHVFVEKPLALNTKDAEELCELASKVNKKLMVGHLLQYHPAFLKLKSMSEAGELGRIQYLYSNRLNLGKIRREEDILWSFAPHDVSMILGLVGSEPEQVHAFGGYYLHKSIADTTITHLEFPAGEQAHIFVSWLHPVKEQKLVVVGDKGMAIFDDGQSWDSKLLFYPHQIEWKQGMPLPTTADAEHIMLNEAEPLFDECEHFIECVVNDLVPRTCGLEGTKVLKVLERATVKLK